MKEGSPGDVFNVRCKLEGAVQSDAEALYLGGEGHRESVDVDGWGWGVL